MKTNDGNSKKNPGGKVNVSLLSFRRTEPEVQFHVFRRLKRGEKKSFEKNLFILKSAYH